MAEDFVDQIFAEQPQEVEPVETVPEPVNEAPTSEPAPEVAEPTPEPAPEPEQRGPGYVPIDAMLTERERRQAVERELEQLRRQQVQQPAAPDPFDDPQAFEQHVQSQIDVRLQQQRAEMSYEFAKDRHGQDAVEAAKAWAIKKAGEDPLFNQQVEAVLRTNTLPFEWVIQQHKRDAMLSEVGDRSMDDFVRDYLTKNPSLLQSAPPVAAPVVAAQQPAPKPAMPPRSIAADASPAASPPNANPMAAMDAIFTR